MPMYYPDLESVRKSAIMMERMHTDSKKYRGIIPQTEEDLPEARIQFGEYFRTVWGDEMSALEVELAVTKEYYEILFFYHMVQCRILFAF